MTENCNMDDIMRIVEASLESIYSYEEGRNSVAYLERFTHPMGFVSSIKVNGKPLLPPLMTARIRDECITHRHQAVLAENRIKAHKRDKLLSQVQHIVDNVEERSSTLRKASGDIDADDDDDEDDDDDDDDDDEGLDNLTVNQSIDFDSGDIPKPSTSHVISNHSSRAVSSTEPQRLSPGEVEHITNGSYIFSSSDSSEYQQTVIARDEASHFKQVAKTLREEKKHLDSSNSMSQGADHVHPDLNASLSPYASDTDSSIKVITDGLSKPSLLSNVCLSPVSDSRSHPIDNEHKSQIDKSSANSIEQNSIVSISEKSWHSDTGLTADDDDAVFQSSDTNLELLSTKSTDIMQYMKGSLSTMSSSHASTLLTGLSIVESTSNRTIIATPESLCDKEHDVTITEFTNDLCDVAHLETATTTDVLGVHSGKREHLKRYLQHLSEQPPPTSEPGSSSTGSEAPDYLTSTSLEAKVQTLEKSGLTLPPFSASFDHISEETIIRYQTQHFDDMRKRLEEQQREQLAHLLWEQQREQYLLQLEMREQERRLKKAEDDILQQTSVVSLNDAESYDNITVLNGAVDANMLKVDNRRKTTIPKVPDKALDVEMQAKFARLSAVAKGYLTRRLLRTEKLQDLIKTIRDTAHFAIAFQSETPIKRGIYSSQDVNLQERVIAQLRAALLEIHDIFFEIPVAQRMSYIAMSRELEQERRLREFENRRSSTGGSSSSLTRRVSSATLKAMERKKRAKVAEEAVLAHFRPKTAPPADFPPNTRNMDLRALKPIQSYHIQQQSTIITNPSKPIKEDFNKAVATYDRPRTAPVRPSNKQQMPTANRTRKSENPSKNVTTTARRNKSTVPSSIPTKPTLASRTKAKTFQH